MQWNDILARVDGKLAVVDSPPVCEPCGGRGAGIGCGAEEHTFHECHDCAGTGLAWHWRVTPTAGMLVAPTGGDDWGVVQNVYESDKYGRVLQWPNYQIPTHTQAGKQLITPMLPPANLPGTTPAELLRLLGDNPDIEGIALRVTHHFPPLLATDFDDEMRPEFRTVSADWPDTAPLELAIQHHKALQAWAVAR